MIDEQKLRELIAEATPGPWFVVGQPWNPKADFIVAGSPDPHMGQYVADTEDFDGEGQNVQENAAWIAAANPAAILALLDELATLRADLAALKASLGEPVAYANPDDMLDASTSFRWVRIGRWATPVYAMKETL